MQFSPKKEEKTLSATRLLIQKKIINNGITPKKLQILKKIELLEFSRTPKYIQNTDIAMFSKVILSAAQVTLYSKGIPLSISVTGDETKRLDRKRFSALLLECCLISNENISVRLSKRLIIIEFTALKASKTLKRLLKQNEAHLFSFYKGDKKAIIIELESNREKSEKITGGIEYMLNPLSQINIYLSSV